MDEIENDTDLKIVVFESGDGDFFVNHHDLARGHGAADQPGGACFDHWPSFVTRLSQLSVLSVAKVRGRARAQGFEFALPATSSLRRRSGRCSRRLRSPAPPFRAAGATC